MTRLFFAMRTFKMRSIIALRFDYVTLLPSRANLPPPLPVTAWTLAKLSFSLSFECRGDFNSKAGAKNIGRQSCEHKRSEKEQGAAKFVGTEAQRPRSEKIRRATNSRCINSHDCKERYNKIVAAIFDWWCARSGPHLLTTTIGKGMLVRWLHSVFGNWQPPARVVVVFHWTLWSAVWNYSPILCSAMMLVHIHNSRKEILDSFTNKIFEC
jgi:hypothetical protein